VEFVLARINIPLASVSLAIGLGLVIVTFDLSDSECVGGGWNVHHGPSRSFNYALAETTAVTKATVIIKINIVTALIAFVVICSPFASYGRRRSKWPTARFTGVEVAFMADRFAVFSILNPGLGRIPESPDSNAIGVPGHKLIRRWRACGCRKPLMKNEIMF
jgi:hypothetical protein